MSFCTSCGGALGADASYCGQCGSKVPESASSEEARVEAEKKGEELERVLTAAVPVSTGMRSRVRTAGPLMAEAKSASAAVPIVRREDTDGAKKQRMSTLFRWVLGLAALFAVTTVMEFVLLQVLLGEPFVLAKVAWYSVSYAVAGLLLVLMFVVATATPRKTAIACGLLAGGLWFSVEWIASIATLSHGMQTSSLASVALGVVPIAGGLAGAHLLGKRLGPTDAMSPWRPVKPKDVLECLLYATVLWMWTPISAVVRTGASIRYVVLYLPLALFWFTVSYAFVRVARKLAETGVVPEAITDAFSPLTGAGGHRYRQIVFTAVGGACLIVLLINATATTCTQRRIQDAGSYYSDQLGGVLGALPDGYASEYSCPLGVPYFGQMDCLFHGRLTYLTERNNQ